MDSCDYISSTLLPFILLCKWKDVGGQNYEFCGKDRPGGRSSLARCARLLCSIRPIIIHFALFKYIFLLCQSA